jgi:anti-anti-sigma factor
MSASRQPNAPSIPDAELRIVVSQVGTTTTIGLEGEWDMATQIAAREAIGRALARRPERLVLDLSRLSFMDSSGVHAVTSLATRTDRLNVRLSIVPAPAAVHRIFEICQLTKRLPFTSAS